MPRPNRGPRLVTVKRRRMREAIYYVRWYDSGQKREKSTGIVVGGVGSCEKAEAWLADFIAARTMRPVGPSDPAEMKIGDVLAIYGEEHAPETADPGRIGDCIAALAPFWGDRPASAIKSETARRYRKTRAPAADGTVRRELGCLRAALNYCIKEGYLTHAPFVWLPPRPAPKDRWLARAEAAALLRAARAEPKARFHLPLFILIAIYTGARRSAILSLRWTQNTAGGWVDLDRGRIEFNPAGRAQTKKRRPVVPIPRRLMTFLRLAKARSSCDHVIAYDGEPVANIKRSFATACRAAGLEGVTRHTLRHTCITWLVQRGVSLWEVGGFVGATTETIERTYGHHAPDYLENARTALDGGPPLFPRNAVKETA